MAAAVIGTILMATTMAITSGAVVGTMGVVTARKAASTTTAHLTTIEATISSSNRNDGKREQPYLSPRKKAIKAPPDGVNRRG